MVWALKWRQYSVTGGYAKVHDHKWPFYIPSLLPISQAVVRTEGEAACGRCSTGPGLGLAPAAWLCLCPARRPAGTENMGQVPQASSSLTLGCHEQISRVLRLLGRELLPPGTQIEVEVVFKVREVPLLLGWGWGSPAKRQSTHLPRAPVPVRGLEALGSQPVRADTRNMGNDSSREKPG